MKSIIRTADAYWNGSLREGDGYVSTASGALDETPYDFRTRFEDAKGSNPEELLAAAHAACFSMAFSATLVKNGFEPDVVHTRAACVMDPKEGGGFKISGMQLTVEVQAGGLDEATLKKLAEETDKGCPVSNLLRSGLEITIQTRLRAG
jgi:osmotically inducible protein OsmC